MYQILLTMSLCCDSAMDAQNTRPCKQIGHSTLPLPQGTMIKNTFIELSPDPDGEGERLRRVSSDSDLSTRLSVYSLSSSNLNDESSRSAKFSTPEEGRANSNSLEQDSLHLYSCLLDLHQARNNPDAEEFLQAQLAKLEQMHMPMNEEDKPMSVGTIAHLESGGTSCKPCRYFETGRCRKGFLCLFCHIPHTDEKKVAFHRPSKNKRDRLKRVAEKKAAESSSSNQLMENSTGANACPEQPSQAHGTRRIISL